LLHTWDRTELDAIRSADTKPSHHEQQLPRARLTIEDVRQRKTSVGIVFGGQSAEHEISILSARNVLAALDRSRFDPVLIGIDKAGRC